MENLQDYTPTIDAPAGWGACLYHSQGAVLVFLRAQRRIQAYLKIRTKEPRPQKFISSLLSLRAKKKSLP